MRVSWRKNINLKGVNGRGVEMQVGIKMLGLIPIFRYTVTYLQTEMC